MPRTRRGGADGGPVALDAQRAFDAVRAEVDAEWGRGPVGAWGSEVVESFVHDPVYLYI